MAEPCSKAEATPSSSPPCAFESEMWVSELLFAAYTLCEPADTATSEESRLAMCDRVSNDCLKEMNHHEEKEDSDEAMLLAKAAASYGAIGKRVKKYGKVYATAVDCSKNDGGICLCASGDVCGCVEPPSTTSGDLEGECETTNDCQDSYPAAVDCKKSAGGVCFCPGNTVCGCDL